MNLREHVECYGRRPILMNDGVPVAGPTNPWGVILFASQQTKEFTRPSTHFKTNEQSKLELIATAPRI